MNRKLRPSILIGLIPVIGLFVFALMHRRPNLELHILSRVTYQGKTVQLQVLAPSGWVEDHSTAYAFDGPILSFSVVPPKRKDWMTELFSSLFRRPRDLDGIVVDIDVKHHPRNTPEIAVTYAQGQMESLWAAKRALPQRPNFVISYYRRDRREFESTYRIVCESFKVSP